MERAVWLVGGPTKTAKLLGVDWHTVYKWRNKGAVHTTEHAVRLSDLTNGAVSVRELAGFKGEGGSPGDGQNGSQTAETSDARGRAATGRDVDESAPVAQMRRRLYAGPAPRTFTRYILCPLVDFAEAA